MRIQVIVVARYATTWQSVYMKVVYYTEAQKREQLQTLVERIEALIKFLKAREMYTDRIPEYEMVMRNCNRLLENGFTQRDRNEIIESIPQLIGYHKEFVPPKENPDDPDSGTAQWFLDLEDYHNPVTSGAWAMRESGYYVPYVEEE